MGLKQAIDDAYETLKKQFEEYKETIDSRPSNQAEVFEKITKLKCDLCKFADDFDKPFINVKILEVKSIDEMYTDIKNEFVERISREKDHFIYSCKEGKTIDTAKAKYIDIINMFNSRYESLLTDFESSKKLIKFFKNSSEKFFGGYDHTYDNWCLEISDIHGTVSINQALEKFMSTIFNAMALELEKRDKLLVANDDEYFFDVAKKIEKLKNSDPEEYKKALEELEKDSRTCETSKKLQITLPSYWRDLAMEYAKLQDKHPIEAVTEPVKVFPTASSPSPAEVKQAFIGDCYLMGSLIALAKNNKKAIKDCFVQGLDKIEKEKNIIIRFFGYKEGTRKKIKISVDKNKIIFPKGITALWPKLIEKAYAIYRKEGHEYGLTDSDNRDFKSNRIRNSLENGNPLDVMIAITGNKPHSSGHDHKDKSKFDPTRVMETIEKKLKSGHSLTCNFRRRFKTKDVKNAETITVYNNHCYAIVGIDRTKKYIRLIEPNKVLGRTYPAKSIGTDKLKPVRDGGHIAMCFDDFKNNFNRIRYTGKKKFL